MPRHECQNCEEVWNDKEIKPIKDLYERVEPGETMPSGECPECGALTHQVNYYTQRVVETRGYLVDYIVVAATVKEARDMAELGDTVEEKQLKRDGGVTNRALIGNPVTVDPPEEKRVALIPGLTTPKGQAELKYLLDRRAYLDYQCYMELQRLQTNGDLARLDDHEKEHIDDLLKGRADVNHAFIEATAGRDADGKTQDNS